MSKNNTFKVDSHNMVSSTELEAIVKAQMMTVMNDPSKSKNLPAILVRGCPGIGKSAIVRSVAKELGVGFIDLRLAQMESCDIRGLPVPTEDGFKWQVASIFPRDKNSKGIMFLDELTSCSKDIQCASYELILDRRLGEYKLPDGWIIVAAGNRVEDRAVAMQMSSALANRFMHFTTQANYEEWVIWAQQNDINPTVVGFINARPALLFNMEGENLEYGWPSPRSWERVSHAIATYKDVSEEVLRKCIYGLIGDHAGVEFFSFYKENSNLDDVFEMMTNPKAEIKIPSTADKKYAMASAASYFLWRGKDEQDENNRISGYYRIMMKMPPDFATLMMTSAMAGNDKKLSDDYCNKMFYHPMCTEWTKMFGKTFKKNLSI